MNEELNKMARSTKVFNQFNQSAEMLDIKYNVNHLKTEYNLAYSVAQSGAQCQRALKDAQHLPYVVFETRIIRGMQGKDWVDTEVQAYYENLLS